MMRITSKILEKDSSARENFHEDSIPIHQKEAKEI